MVELLNSQSRLFLTTIDLYRKRGKRTFRKLYTSCDKKQIDGIYTHFISGLRLTKYGSSYSKSRYSNSDIFDHGGVVFLIDNEYHKGKFPNLKESRINFDVNDNGDTCCILMHHIILIADNTEQLDGSFTLVMETIMPDIDMISSKLMM